MAATRAAAIAVLLLAAVTLSSASATPGAETNYDDDMTDEDESGERERSPGSPSDGDLLPPMSASSPLPLFLEEPKDAYVVKNLHATLRCSAINALQVYFKCSNAAKTTAHHQQEFVDPHDGVRHVEATVNVTRQDVEEFFGDKFSCVCFAWSSRGKIRSRPATVTIAYIKKQFAAPPYGTRVALGAQAELRCLPPGGFPAPTVTWQRNGQPLPTDSQGSVFVSGEGHLLVNRARLEDQANYTCVAENLAGKRVSDPAPLTVYVDGGWSAWSSWSDCSATCGRGQQRRTRHCTKPAPANGGKECPGATSQKTDCISECPDVRSDSAPQAKYDGVQLTEEAEGELHAALYVGLGVAFSVFSLVAVLLVRVLRRRGRRGRRAYTQASTEYPADFLPDIDKKGPDLTQTVPVGLGTVGPPLGSLEAHPITNGSLSGFGAPLGCYRCPLPLSRNEPEHHYDEPHLATSSATSSSSSCSTASASTSPSATSTRTVGSSRADSGSVALSGGESALDSGITMTSCSVSSAGARLSLPDCGVSLIIPEGALARGQEALVSLAVLTEDRVRPRLAEGQTLLSGVVQVGPPGLVLNKPAVLSLRHCVAVSSDWRLSVWGSHDLPGDAPVWKELLSVGAETINTPAFVQLDATQMFLMWDQLSAIVLVGEAATRDAAKRIQLAVFAEARGTGVRVYVLEDTGAALQSVIHAERRLGSRLAAAPQTLVFRDGNGALVLDLDLPDGRTQEHQEIPFRHVWSCNTSQLHCAFSLPSTPRLLADSNGILFRVRARQDYDPVGVTFVATPGGKVSLSPPIGGNTTRTLVTSTNARHTSCSVDSDNFRLSRTLRQQLAQCLDPPNARGNDWRMLAQRLMVDRYINYFATKPSPTDVILSLWESRSRESTALPDLINTLRLMGRPDAAQLLQKDTGPSWV